MSFLRACAAVNSVKLSEPLASDPMPLVAAVTKVVADAAGNALLAEQDRAVAEDAAQYLVERLSAITALAEGKSAGVQLVPRGLDGRREPARTLLFDVARTLAKKMPLMKLVELDQDVRPYLAALMVAAMAKAGQVLHVPRRLSVREVPDQEFDELLRTMAGQQYHSYGTLGRELGGGVLEGAG